MAANKSVQELSNPQKDGFLYKYGVKGIAANWSKRWFVLRDGYLYYFKEANSQKQSGVISLSTYNKISDGGKTKKYSFKLESGVNPKARTYYLCAETEEELTAWRREIISSIKGRALISRKSVSMTSLLEPARKICILYINVSEARNLPQRDMLGKSDPYLIADAGGCQARTRTIYKSLNPFWGEEYHLNIVDSFTRDPSASIKITVWDEDKYVKDNLIGQVTVPVVSLCDSKIHEQWYPLYSSDAEIYVSGDLHLRIDHNSEAKTLTLRIIEGRNLASKDANGLSDPYVKVYFGKHKKKTKIVKKSLNPFFNEEFVFEVPDSFYKADQRTDADSLIVISCWDWDRLGSNEFMGEFSLRLHELESDVIHDMWYILLPKGDMSVPFDKDVSSLNLLSTNSPHAQPKPLGEIRIKLRYTEDPALPTYIYQPLLDFLQGPLGPTLAQLIEQVIGPSERGELATAMIVALEAYGTAVPLIKALLKAEIQATEQEETLFRGNSLVTKGLDSYMKLVATPYLDHVIGPTIKKIYTSKKSCEVDPTREKEENIPKNFTRLLKLAQTIINAVVASASACPPRLREIFHSLQTAVQEKLGPNSPAKYAVVSSFLFLRHICPAILNPKLFQLASDHPDQRIARTLTLLSKTIQNLANLVTFGQKEPYMLKMNDFIVAHMSAMKTFIDHVSTPPTSPPPEPANPPPKNDEDLVTAGASMFRYFERAMPDLQALAGTHSLAAQKKEAVSEAMIIYTRIVQYRNKVTQ